MSKINLGNTPQKTTILLTADTPEQRATAAAVEKMMEEKSQPVSAGEFSQQQSTSSPTDASAPTHFDALISDAQAVDVAAQAPAAPPVIDRAGFVAMFVGTFNMAGGMTGLQSLRIGPERQESAEACANELYDVILETPSLHWMLSPQGKTWRRIMVIGAFVVPMGRGVADEMRQRRKPPANLNFSEAKKASRSTSTDPDDPPAESLAALNNRP